MYIMLTDKDCIFNINYCFHVRGSLESAKVVPICAAQRSSGVSNGCSTSNSLNLLSPHLWQHQTKDNSLGRNDWQQYQQINAFYYY